MTDTDPYFPAISDDQARPFLVLKQLLAENSALLDHPGCPYPAEIKAIFASERSEDPFQTRPELGEGVDQLAIEIQELHDELTGYRANLTSDDNAEMMAYFRVRASLLEKITTMKERASGLKKVSEFQSVVMGILEDLMTPDQRTEMMRRIGIAIGSAS